jgi:hypothetical protein
MWPPISIIRPKGFFGAAEGIVAEQRSCPTWAISSRRDQASGDQGVEQAVHHHAADRRHPCGAPSHSALIEAQVRWKNPVIAPQWL